jgi:hypothetical protein
MSGEEGGMYVYGRCVVLKGECGNEAEACGVHVSWWGVRHRCEEAVKCVCMSLRVWWSGCSVDGDELMCVWRMAVCVHDAVA